MEMIQLQNVERSYKAGAGASYVLRRINLDIHEGDFITIMGPSGAGKSTLLSILGMLDDNWSGEYYFLEHAVHKMDRKKRSDLSRQYIGFVFQSYHLLDDLTVYENLDVPLSYRNLPARSARAWWPRFLIVFKLWVRKICIPASSPAASSSW